MLGDPHSPGGHAQCGPGLLGGQPDRHAQQEQLTLVRRQQLEQAAGGRGLAAADRVVLRTRTAVGGLREVVRGHRGPDRRALRVGDLVGGDAEDERLERASFVAVPRQGGQHGETDLLGHVVGGVLASGQPP